MPEHNVALHQGPRQPETAPPTAHEQHTIDLLAPGKRSSQDTIRLRPTEAVPEVCHIELEAVWLQIVPGAEGVVPQVIVVGEPDTLSGCFEHRCRHHVKVPKVPKERKARVVIPDQAR